MKPPSKISLVASSPGRAEKLPAPPFSRLLKGKGGSRSRRSSSLSRASPMFMSRRRSGSAEVEKEPGSPKVTCIGQVRITKKKKVNNGAGGELPSKEHQLNRGVPEKAQKQSEHQQDATGDQSGCCECRCFHPAGFCNPFTKLPKQKRSRGAAQQGSSTDRSRRRMWRGWFSPRCCYSGRCREPKEKKQLLETDAAAFEEEGAASHAKQQRDFFARSPVRRDWMSKVAAAGSEDGNAAEPSKEEQEEEDCGTKAKGDDLAPTTPPKNALLLMRCRSAPQGAASPFARRITAPEEATAHSADDVVTKRILDSRPQTASPVVASSSGSVFIQAKDEDIIIKTPNRAPSTNDASHGNGFPKPSECSRDSAANNDAGSCTSEEADEVASAVGPSPSFSSVPLILTRCQSAPAHKASKLASTSAITPPESSSRLWSVDNNNNNNNNSGKSVEHAAFGRDR